MHTIEVTNLHDNITSVIGKFSQRILYELHAYITFRVSIEIHKMFFPNNILIQLLYGLSNLFQSFEEQSQLNFRAILIEIENH